MGWGSGTTRPAWVLIAARLAYIDPETEQTVFAAIIATRRPLSGLLRALRSASRAPR